MSKRICTGFILICLLLTMPACAVGAGQPAAGNVEKISNQTDGFTDVPSDAWYAGAVQYCRENGLMAGTSDTTFAPEATLTRAMLVTILWRQAEKPVVNYLMQFSDVPEGQWYSEAVRWAASETLVAGYGDGRFGTNDPITQEQLDLIFQRYTDRPVTDGIPSFDGSSKPVTRAQAAAAVMHYARLSQQGTTAGKVLVAYFSWSGNGQQMARWISEETGGELFRIVPSESYGEDFNTCADRAKDELDNGIRPELSEHIDADTMAQYDVVYLGFPVWWYDLPMPVWTFLEEYDLSGKTVIPFFSHNGSSNGANSVNRVAELAEGATVLTDRALSLRGSNVADSETEVKDWAKEFSR